MIFVVFIDGQLKYCVSEIWLSITGGQWQQKV